jgi:fatty acid desaturase
MTVASPETEMESPLTLLSAEQLDELADELDAIYERVRADLGDRDRRYAESIVALHRRLEAMGRGLLIGSANPALRAAGAAALASAKTLENMELGHNVLHGQWDWMNEPRLNSASWDWDIASTPEAWKHTHNYIHHTFTNIIGKDKDLGYMIMRVDPAQKWHPVYLLQPLYNLVLAALFEWAVALHDFDTMAILEKTEPDVFSRKLRVFFPKAKDQIVKDYVAWPLVSAVVASAAGLAVDAVAAARPGGNGRDRREILRRALARGKRTFRKTAKANAAANVARNVWTYSTIFCGHFPDQTYTFTEEEVEDESRGAYLVRQMTGSADIQGSDLFHVASGHIGFQVEHHLYPDLPSPRYKEIAPEVQEICERYGLPYNSGPFLRQFAMAQRTILRLALPGGKVRPKPGPYRRQGAAA